MVDPAVFEKVLKIIPLIKKLNLSDIGAIIVIFHFLCKNNYITPVTSIALINEYFLYVGVLFIILGLLRNSSSIDLTYDILSGEILHIYKLKMGATTQASLNISLDNESWKESLTKKFTKIIDFYYILEYLDDQIEVTVPTHYNACIMPYGMRIFMSKYISRSNSICTITIRIKNYENNKKLKVYLKPESNNKIISILTSLLSLILYSQKKELLIVI